MTLVLDALRPSATLVPTPYDVVDVRREAPDVVTLALAPARAATPLPPARPGQFHMVYVPAVGEVPISVSADPVTTVVEHTIRAVGAVTQALCELGPGDPVGLRGPFGRGWDLDALAGGDGVLVAGGIGLAPLKPAIERLLAERDRYDRLVLLLGARTPSDLCFAGRLDEWRAAGLHVDVTVDYAEPGWRGAVGLVTQLVARAPFTPGRAGALVCGPEAMMRFAAQALVARGVDPDRVEVSLERNMQCAVGRCGHCQLGEAFVCADGPVLPWTAADPLLRVAER